MERASNDYIHLTKRDWQAYCVDDIRISLNNHSKGLYYYFWVVNTALYYMLVFFNDYNGFTCLLLCITLQHIAIEYGDIILRSNKKQPWQTKNGRYEMSVGISKAHHETH